MEIVGFVLVMALLFWYDWVHIPDRGGEKGEMTAFALLMAAAFLLGIASASGVPLPNPTTALQRVFDPFTMSR